MAFVKPRLILQQGTRADQPAASAVAEGTLYYVTDELVIERSNASTWDSWTIAGSGGGSWIPLVDGAEPPSLISDGAGHLILVAYP
jgi:hypothetical protein